MQVTVLEQRDLLAGFTPGNLVINTVGTGAALDGSATAVTLREYGLDNVDTPTSATLVNSIAAPSSNSGNNSGNLTDSGSTASHGALNLSVDGTRISLVGYDAPTGSANIATSSTSTNNRVVGTVNAAGQIALDSYADAFSGGSIRAAISSSATTHWLAGTTGVRYGSGGTSTSVVSNAARFVTIATDASGNSFLVGNTGASVFAWTSPSPMPTSAVTPQTLTLPGLGSDLGEVVMLDRSPTRGATNLGGIDTIYVTNGQAGTSGTLSKYEWSGTAWVSRNSWSYTTGLNGLAARITAGGNVEFFTTTRVNTGGNQLLTRTDTAGFGNAISAGGFTLLATAETGYAFRGVTFASDELVEATLDFSVSGAVNAGGSSTTLINQVTYSNGSSFKGGSLVVSGGHTGDTLSISNLAGLITTSGNSVLYNGTPIGTVSGGTDTTALRVDFNARNSVNNVTEAMAEQLLKQIQMATTTSDASRSLTFTLSQASDHKANVDSVSKTVNFPINQPPTAVQFTTATTSLPENTPTTSSVFLANLTVTDDIFGSNLFSLSGDDAAFFEIVDQKLRLKAGTALDFETKPSYSVTVGVDDPSVGSTPDATATFTLSITDVNEPPTAVVLTNVVPDVEEQTLAADLKVADIVVTDDALGAESITLSGADASSFRVVGNELFLRAGAYSSSVQNIYSVTINVDDTTVGTTPDAMVDFVLNILPANRAPTALTVIHAIAALNENASTAGGIKLGDVSVTDDGKGTNALTLSGSNADAFELRGSELWLKDGVMLNYEAQNSYAVTIAVDDSSVGTTPDATTNFTLSILDVNEAPTVGFTGAVTQILESALSPSPRKMADIVIDDDALGSETLTLGGADAGLFELVGMELFLKAGTTFDFETKSMYSVSVAVDDPTVGGTPDYIATLALQVLDVDEPPEADISVNAVGVADGGTVNFGSVAPNTATVRTFTLTNTGTGALTLQPIIITGSDFTLSGANFTAGQVLAVNATVSFTVTMNTTTAGTKSGGFSFLNNDSDESPYDIVLTGAVVTPNSGSALIDDGDPGFSNTGTWFNVTGYGYGSDAKAASGSDGSKKSTWIFDGLAAGQYRIEATWLPGTDRTNTAPYRFRDGVGGPLVGTASINQRNVPSGATNAGGRPFAALGSVHITGDTLVVELSNTSTSGAIIADAVRIVSVTSPPNTPEIDVLDGTSSLSDGAGYDFGQVTQGATVTKSFTVKNTGAADLALQPFTVTGSAFSLASPNFTAGQILAPNATAIITIAFNTSNLGMFTGGLSLGNTDADEGPFDLSFSGKVNPAGATSVTLDDGDAGFVLTGAWNNVTGYGYGSDAKSAAGSNGASKATWTFSGLTPGEYKINTTWLPGTDRTNNAPYVIRDGVGGAILSTVSVNQRNAPAGAASEGGRPFSSLGNVNITGTALTIELANTGTNGVLIADAIRVERVAAAPNAPRIDVTDGANTLLVHSTLSFGSATQNGPALTKTVTVKNTGTADLVLQPIAVTGTGFSLISPNFSAGQALAPNALVTITVQFSTAATGTFSGALSFGHNDGGPFDLQLTGTINAAPPAGVFLIDDGDTGFSTTGTWLNVSGYGYGNDALATAGSDSTKKTMWTFTGLTAGTYQVDATWLPGTDRANNVPCWFRDGIGGSVLGNPLINQRNVPSGALSAGGRPFATIGTVTITGNVLVVELANSGTNGVSIADAVRITKTA